MEAMRLGAGEPTQSRGRVSAPGTGKSSHVVRAGASQTKERSREKTGLRTGLVASHSFPAGAKLAEPMISEGKDFALKALVPLLEFQPQHESAFLSE